MSGGGDSKSKKSKKEESSGLPGYMTEGPMVQPFMPGWDNMISNQLAAGGYGSAPDLLTYIQQFYSPMQVPGASPAPAPGGGGGGSGGGGSKSGGNGSGGFRLGQRANDMTHPNDMRLWGR